MSVKKVIFSHRQIADAVDKTVAYIKEVALDKRKIMLIPVLDGALSYFMHICRILDKQGIPYDYQSIYIRGYGMNGSPQTPEIIKGMIGTWEDYYCFMIDDIFDKGFVAKIALRHLTNGAFYISGSNLSACFLLSKIGNKFNVEGIDCYSPLAVSNLPWVSGFGMDDDFRCRGDREIWVKNLGEEN